MTSARLTFTREFKKIGVTEGFITTIIFNDKKIVSQILWNDLYIDNARNLKSNFDIGTSSFIDIEPSFFELREFKKYLNFYLTKDRYQNRPQHDKSVFSNYFISINFGKIKSSKLAEALILSFFERKASKVSPLMIIDKKEVKELQSEISSYLKIHSEELSPEELEEKKQKELEEEKRLLEEKNYWDTLNSF